MSMTLKQIARAQFLAALDAYKTAVASGDSKAFVAASVRLHASRVGVPKSWRRMIPRAPKFGA